MFAILSFQPGSFKDKRRNLDAMLWTQYDMYRCSIATDAAARGYDRGGMDLACLSGADGASQWAGFDLA
jgi:hypothetical protein